MDKSPTNQLQYEKSPYLLQHKDNPIAWQSWGATAFEQARRGNKPIFLSVGYSTCHWCHVMAHESFEDREVAEILNQNFVSIKVDREEHPDVDDVYMSALQVLSGGGGWPMSVWLTPEGKPFFAGTYFPKPHFMQLLRRIAEIWTSEGDKLVADSERLTASIKQMAQINAPDSHEVDWEEFLRGYAGHFRQHFDALNGGFGGAPKFPQTMNLMVLLRLEKDSAAGMVNATLGKMVRGGVYDQLQGGFHRYAVDEKWLIPHFEKMLYDQSLLCLAMLEAHQVQPQAELARAVSETLDYVLREMSDAQGGFYSAQDADSLTPDGHSEEGYFCTFAYGELRQTLTTEELKRVQEVYGVTNEGQFEGRNILHLQDGFDGRDKEDPVLHQALVKMRELRAKRPAPHLDDKVIAAWNGWMIWALSRAGVVLDRPDYIQAAQKALNFLKFKLWRDGELARFWRQGQASGRGAADDYASVIHACLELYQVDFNPAWAAWALELQQVLDQKFWDHDEGTYFANDGGNSLLPMRPHDDYDGVTPCSNSMSAYNLVRLYLLTGEGRFHQQGERILSGLFGKLRQYPSGLPFLALAMDFQLNDAKVVVLSGEGWVRDYYQRERQRFEPYRLWAKADGGWPVEQGKSVIQPALYICEEGRCLAPITTPQ